MPTLGADRDANARVDPVVIGERLRQERERQGLSLRELARRVDLSPSFISQVERGFASPSVATLYQIVSQLDLSLDALFAGSGGGPDEPRPPDASPVVTPDRRHVVELASGVRLERLTAEPESDVDFLYAVYDVGGASSDRGVMTRHGGREYGYVLEGRLGLSIGFETWEMAPGDSVAFDSSIPHRLWAIGDTAAVVVWLVLGRRDDPPREQRSNANVAP